MLVTHPRRFSYSLNTTQTRAFPGWVYGGIPPQVSTSRSAGSYAWTDSRLTFNSPSWRWRIANHLNATGSLTGYLETYDAVDGNLYKVIHSQYQGASWFIDYTSTTGNLMQISAPAGLGLSDTRANNRALQKFYEHAREAQTTLQGLVVAGELGQTIRGVNQAANGVYRLLWNYINTLRRGDVLKTLRLLSKEGKLKFVADRWLEFVFAAKPLYSDIQDAAAALSDHINDFRQDFKRVQGKGEDEMALQVSTTFMSDYGYSTLGRELIEIRYYGLVERSTPYAGVADVTPWGFDVHNWAPSLWELLPYSWLLDYFGNFQHLISAWSFNTASIRWVSRTVRTTRSTEAYSHFLVNPQTKPNVKNLNPGSTLRTTKSVVRTAIDQLGVPTLEFFLPGASTKWLNLGALFASSRRVQNIIW